MPLIRLASMRPFAPLENAPRARWMPRLWRCACAFLGIAAAALTVAGLVALCLATSGCAFVTRAPVTGLIYLDTQQGESIASNDVGTKRGEACATSILGWVATGDASVAAAARAGGITKISHVDSTASDILLVYAEYCTVVYGS